MRTSIIRIFAGLVLATCWVSAQTAAKPAAPATAKSTSSFPPPTLPSEATVDGFLQQTFGYQKDLTWKISSIKPAPVPGLSQVDLVLASDKGQQLMRFYVTPDGEHAIAGDIMPFGPKPFEPVRKVLDKGMTGPTRGPKDAAVTIVEFGDLQCPACKAAQPAIEGLVAAEPKARFVFQNFPLEMHNWAAKGAAYSDCVGRASNEAFWKFVSKTYETQADITAENADEKLTALADGAGVKGADIAACAAKPETKARVDASIALGKSVEVTGTPSLFINGRKIGNVAGLPPEMLKSLADFAGEPAK